MGLAIAEDVKPGGRRPIRSKFGIDLALAEILNRSAHESSLGRGSRSSI